MVVTCPEGVIFRIWPLFLSFTIKSSFESTEMAVM